jgi:predicted nucleic acid-binding protein
MSLYVVDASVAAKWFFEEDHTSAALKLLDDENQLHAPDFLLLEIDSLLWKRIRRKEISETQAREVRKAIRKFPIRLHPYTELLDPAWELANKTGQTVYDCVYLALALLLDCEMVTADRKFFTNVSKDPYGNHSKWIVEIV